MRVQHGCPQGRYGEEPELRNSSCSGVCADGFVCPTGSTSRTSTPCPSGAYCADGLLVPCPAGRFMRSGVTAAVSQSSCLLCPAGRYSAAVGVVDDNATVCSACVWPESSDPGSAECWPGVLYVNASNPPPLEVGLSVGDVVTVAFSKDTNKFGADAEGVILFQPSIGEVVTSWLSDRLMVLRLVSTASVVDFAAADIGVLQATVLASAEVRSKHGSSSLPNTTVMVGGTWGVPAPPRILQVVVLDTGRQGGVGPGDRMRIAFDQRVAQLPLPTAALVDTVLQFTPALSDFGVSYVGVWWSATALDVVITSGRVESATELAVGALNVSTLPSGGLTSLNGQSGASNDSARVMEGSWGDVPLGTVEGKTARSLRVELTPPSNRFGYAVERYVVQWSTAADVAHASTWDELASLPLSSRYNTSLGPEFGFGAVLEVELRDVTAETSGVALLRLRGSRLESAAFDIDGLRVGVEYFVFVACNNLRALGPYTPSTPPSRSPNVPVIKRLGVSARRLNGAGGDVISVTGSRLGDPSVELVVLVLQNAVYSFRSPPCVAVVVFAELQCISPAGVGSGFHVGVEVDGVLSSWFPTTLSYDVPQVFEFLGAGATDGETAGEQVVVLYGRNFGATFMDPLPLQSVVYSPLGLPYVYTAADCAITLNHTEITCRTVPGVGERLLWTVAVAEQESTNPRTRYARPVISHIRVVDAVEATTGGGAAAVGANATATTTVLLQTEGGQLMVITGQFFGRASPSYLSVVEAHGDIAGRVLRAVNCRVTVDNVEVQCTTPSGVGTGYRWSIVVGDQRSLPYAVAMSYLPPVITSAGVDGGRLTRTAGGSLLSFVGANLGDDLSAVVITWNGAPMPSVYYERNFRELRVRTLAGEGANVTVTLWVGGQQAVLPGDSQWLVFKAPSLASVELASSSSLLFDCSSVGDNGVGGGGLSTLEVSLVLTGQDFGFGPNTAVRAGSGVCTPDVSQSGHTRIVCSTRQCVGDVVISVGGKSSAAVPYEYNALVQVPHIDGVFPVGGPTVGGTEVRILGSQFRLSGSVSFVEVDASFVRTNVSAPCVVTSYSPTEIKCVSPPGDGGRFEVVVTAQGFSSPLYLPLWRYFSPVILSTDTPQLPTHPQGVVLTLFGRNFGWRGMTQGSVTVGSRPCAVVAWNDTEVKCLAPVGVMSQAAVEMVSSGIPSTDANNPPSVFVRYDAPAVYGAAPLLWNSTGGGVLTVVGRDFGVPFPVTVWLHRGVLVNDAKVLPGVRGVLVCPVMAANSSATVILCIMPAGYDSDWVVTVINHANTTDSFLQAQVAANASVRVGYEPPSLTSVAVVRASGTASGSHSDPHAAFVEVRGDGAAPAVGGFLVRLRGRNLSTRPVVQLSGDECVLIGEVSPAHDSVVCSVPPRRISTDALLVVLSGSYVSNAIHLEFDAPAVTDVQPRLITAMSHKQPSTLHVSGVNFGVVLPLVQSSHSVAIGGVKCLAVSWQSDSALTCLFAEELDVGWHNVTVWVRDDESPPTNVSVRAECLPSFYARDGERCMPCPEGSTCAGGMTEPVAIKGFFPVARGVFVLCQPREACLGGANNTCHRNYAGPRCADCATGTYRCVEAVVRVLVCEV